MTFVGHSLTGAAIAVLAVRPQSSCRRVALTLAVFVVLANVPDLPFPNWGHDRYDISHSIFTIFPLVLIFSAFIILSPSLRTRAGGAAVVLAGALACCSHLLLDTFYNHGMGLAMFWPVSSGRVALPIPWFETLRTSLPKVTPHSLRVFGIEFLCYGPVFFAAVFWRFRGNKAGTDVNVR